MNIAGGNIFLNNLLTRDCGHIYFWIYNVLDAILIYLFFTECVVFVSWKHRKIAVLMKTSGLLLLIHITAFENAVFFKI